MSGFKGRGTGKSKRGGRGGRGEGEGNFGEGPSSNLNVDGERAERYTRGLLLGVKCGGFVTKAFPLNKNLHAWFNGGEQSCSKHLSFGLNTAERLTKKTLRD